jgi:FkbM family methyltransferase
MELFNEILSLKELADKPPVLVDIGASGQIHKPWEKIRKHSVCIAFDADEREFSFVKEEVGKFKKLLIYNCIVTEAEKGETDFFLTRSPYCSSLLQPDEKALKDWAFAEKFEVEKKVKIKTRSLVSVLNEAKIDYIDWFKTDSQGTDLRLFSSLPEQIRKKVLTAEFEPGILDSYKGEDKLFRLMEFMDDQDFWMSEIEVKGTKRISIENLNMISNNENVKRFIQHSMKISPGWAEVKYFNSFKGNLERREFLLGWIFAVIKKQYGFALALANEGLQKFGDKIFQEMKVQSFRQIKRNVIKLKFLPSVFEKIKSLIIN